MDHVIMAVAFDLDGTIYFGDRVADGALELIEFLKEKGIDIVFFTNSSYSSREEIYRKLVSMGFTLSVDDVYTSGYAAAVYLRQKNYLKVSCIGSDSLRKELEGFHLQVVDAEDDVDALVIGLDPEFSYERLAWAINLYKISGCKIIACNRDANYPSREGRIMPGCGPIVVAVETACEAEAEFMVGKPNTFMMDLFLRTRGYDYSQILIVGDSYSSDVQMAINCKCRSVLISEKNCTFTGTSICKDLSEFRELLCSTWL